MVEAHLGVKWPTPVPDNSSTEAVLCAQPGQPQTMGEGAGEMASTPTRAIRTVCTVGRLLAVVGLLLAAATMARAIADPARMSTLTAGAVLGVIFLAFLADRFLGSVMDRIDRFNPGSATGQPTADATELRDAA
ncbi:MAG: hypothetical protein IT435_00960 [Phycisphaerales bacterium]|nr:hypothetical protein [Phycisphaerales bacterium]